MRALRSGFYRWVILIFFGIVLISAMNARVVADNPVSLTPKAPAVPRINGARVFGVRPGNPFLFTIAATGDRPMKFSADGLPASLVLDPESGRITGSLKEKGETVVVLKADNALGHAEGRLRIVCGDTIALTPPMGWNSWNCFADAVDDAKVRAAADAMVSSGLINHGWTYINIDDCWQGERDGNGAIQSNQKFPDMKALADYVHAKGLKFGIYSSPGPRTCAGFAGSYHFEDKDAERYGQWGVDYVKYDWCSYGKLPAVLEAQQKMGTVAHDSFPLVVLKKPYADFRASLNKVNRDIVYSFCQYGMGEVWKWGQELGGNSWRTTNDINDSWASVSGIGFSQAGHEPYAGPGHWNDPDMLVVGQVGWGPRLHATRLTPDEQYTHIGLWCLLCAPLLIGCDMSQLDDFTLGLLTNDEVLEVSQDPLGRQASRMAKVGDQEVWAKEMEDGSKAIGLFNRSDAEATVTLNWSDASLTGRQVLRDLFRQKDLGIFETKYTAPVPPHGTILLRVRAAN